MQDHDSVKNELQTLIMLEQQQASALHSLNSKADMGGMPVGGAHFGMPGTGLYGPSVYGGICGAGIGTADFAMTANLDSANHVWLNQSKLSAEARQLGVSRGGERLATGTMSALSGAASIGTTLLAGGIGGALGGAAIGLGIDIGADQLKQNYAYDQYLLQNSYRFINMMESNNKRGVAGFNRSERWETANFLRHFNTDMKISDDDTMTILKGFTEGDLLREAKDVETFKDQMTKLTKSLKTMALTLNESYEEVAELMSTMKKQGIDTRNYEVYAAQSKIVGGLIGADAADTMQYQLSTASSLTAGTMLSTDRMMGTVGSAQAYMGKIYDEALAGKDMSQEMALRYNRIVNRGGVDAATSDYLSATSGILRNNQIMGYYGASFFDWDGTTWQFNRSAFDAYTSGNMSMSELQKISSSKLNASGNAGKSMWQNIGSELLENSLANVSDRASLIKGWINAARATNPSMQNMADAEVMKYVLGLSGEDSTFVADITGLISADGGKYYDKVVSASVAQRFMDELNSNRVGAGYAMKNWWGSVKDTVGDFFSPIGRGWNAMTEKIQDWYYGKEYYDVKKLWSDTDFTKSFGEQFDSTYYTDLIKSLGELATEFEKTAPKLSASFRQLASGIGAMSSVGAATGTESYGIGLYGWGNLTNYKSYTSGYSMWNDEGQYNFVKDFYTGLNEAGGFGFTAGHNGTFSAADRAAMLSGGMDKYIEIMKNPKNASSDAINFARAFEQYNLNVNKLDGFDKAYRTVISTSGNSALGGSVRTINGIDGQLRELGINSGGSGGNDIVSTYNSIMSEIEEVEKINEAFLVAQEKIGDRTGIFAQANVNGYGFVRKKDGTYDSMSYESGLPVATGVGADEYSAKLEQLRNDGRLAKSAKLINSYEGYASGYAAVAGIIGMDKNTRKNMTDLLQSGTSFANLDEAAKMLTPYMLDGLVTNAHVGTVEDLKNQVLGLSWVKNMGGTQIVGGAFDSWASDNEIVNGSRLDSGKLNDLVGYIVEAATAGGSLDSAAKEEREENLAKDVYAIRQMLSHGIIGEKKQSEYDNEYVDRQGNNIEIPVDKSKGT